jgi:hypothetical protein
MSMNSPRAVAGLACATMAVYCSVYQRDIKATQKWVNASVARLGVQGSLIACMWIFYFAVVLPLHIQRARMTRSDTDT